MNDIAIQVENLGKQYRIGSSQASNDRIGEQLAHMLMTPVRRAGKLLRGQATGAAELDETFWALRNVNFEISKGEVVGIIGRNGAGKSTLLKILSRITEPTEGLADIYGRVGSLLEVGTGFHPELTGRENVYLNGGILGMRSREIDSKFDEIVSFAELEQFVDTPVKHYSSGMYVRLAFSVAAHLETEILLVDEVLAVGDLAFQRKCLGKMEGVASQGRTVLFVSHNMALVQSLCERSILIEDGTIRMDGNTNDAIGAYVEGMELSGQQSLVDRTDRSGLGVTRLVNIDISNGKQPGSPVLITGESALFTFEVSHLLPRLSCLFVIMDGLGRRVAMFQSDTPGPQDTFDRSLGTRFECEIERLLLLPGRYRVHTLLRDGGGKQDRVEAAAFFDVVEGQIDGRPARMLSNGISVTIPHRWRIPSTSPSTNGPSEAPSSE